MKNPKLICLAGALAASTCLSSSPMAQAQGVPPQGVPPKKAARQSLFVRAGLLHPGSVATLSLVKRGAASAQAPTGLRSLQQQAVGTGPLSFVLSGFTEQETSDLSAYIQKVYPKLVSIYGLPAPSQRGRTVRIVKSTDSSTGGGQYDARSDSATFNTIYYYLFGSDTYGYVELNHYNLTRQMLLAFRGSQLTDFDAWDGGQSDAAALIVNWQMQGQPATFDPTVYGVYTLAYYDVLNRPQLGNKYFFTPLEQSHFKKPVDSSYYLALVRYGMAQAAWLKVWIENPAFFSQFNARYYLRNTGVVGKDSNVLAAIAGSLVPKVEGLSWNDWRRRQYVLDTSIHAGDHIYAFTLQREGLQGAKASLFAQAYHFTTNTLGDELPLYGVGTLRAYDESGRDITSLSPALRRDNKLYFGTAGEAEINGQDANADNHYADFDSTGSPDLARLALRFNYGSLEFSTFYAHNAIGAESKLNGFYGVTTGTTAGRFALQSNGVSTSGVVQRGAWLSPSTYASGPRVKTIFSLAPTDGGRPQQFQRNTAWSFLQTGVSAGTPQGVGFVFETPPSNASITATWQIRNANHWRLISVPVTPTEADEASALRIPAATLATSLARPVAALRKTDLSKGFPFGITSAKHVFYPRSTSYAPLGPGRAYWLKLASDKVVTIKGGEPERAYAFDVPLTAGWNAVGVPFNLAFPLASLQVRLGEEIVGWADAVKAGWVAPAVWSWQPEGGYARADLSGTLAPLGGYFVFTNKPGATLIFDPAKRTGTLPSMSDGIGAWSVGLSVSSGVGAAYAHEDRFSFGSTAFNGTQPTRIAAARPPWGERSLALAFLSSGSPATDRTRAGDEAGWAESFVPPLGALGARWNFVVDGATSGQRVSLSWGDLSAVPAGFKLFLVDETAGTRQEMVRGGARSYAWIAGGIAGSGAHKLRIEAVATAGSSNGA